MIRIDENRGLGGKYIRLFYRYGTDNFDWYVRDLISEATDGEPINDAVYERNQRVAERYNAVIEGIAGNVQFYAMGDLSSSDNRAIRCLYFNKDLFTQNDIPFPYQSVRDGTWTHEKFFELVSLGGADLNGDGKMKEDEDPYGLYAQGSINANLFISRILPTITAISTPKS